MRQFVFYTLLVAGMASVSFSRPVPALPDVKLSVVEDELCLLPQPTNLQLVGATSTSLMFQWNVAKGAAFYRVRIYASASDELYQTLNLPALPGTTNSYIAEGLVPGVTYGITLSSVCPNGVESQ